MNVNIHTGLDIGGDRGALATTNLRMGGIAYLIWRIQQFQKTLLKMNLHVTYLIHCNFFRNHSKNIRLHLSPPPPACPQISMVFKPLTHENNQAGYAHIFLALGLGQLTQDYFRSSIRNISDYIIFYESKGKKKDNYYSFML